MANASAGPARLIFISDFLIDADLTSAQQQYVNEFESSAEIQTPLIYAWMKDSQIGLRSNTFSTTLAGSTKPRKRPSLLFLSAAWLQSAPARIFSLAFSRLLSVFQSLRSTGTKIPGQVNTNGQFWAIGHDPRLLTLDEIGRFRDRSIGASRRWATSSSR